ncbi:MAG: POTRA domain-containing protein, partial [Opitutales bacterium]|nr:POTRA domain-containing protein [Opitutales bacterium]
MRLFTSLLCFSVCVATLIADSYSGGKTISTIQIEISGPPTVGESYVKQNLQVQEGDRYKTSSIDKSIRNLMETGSIRDVKVFKDPVSSKNDVVALVFKVVTKPRIEEIRFNGNDELSDKKLLKSISSKVGELYDESKVKSDILSLESLYLEKGFWNSDVSYQVLQGVEEPEKKILSFFIEENELRKIRRILFS